MLTGDFVISNANAIRDELSQNLADDASDWTIDMSGITDLDTSGLQLLLMMRRAISNTRVCSCPTHLREFIESVGLTQLLI